MTFTLNKKLFPLFVFLSFLIFLLFVLLPPLPFSFLFLIHLDLLYTAFSSPEATPGTSRRFLAEGPADDAHESDRIFHVEGRP